MNSKHLLIFGFFLFLSCTLKEEVYENDYLKLIIPDGWVITDKNNSENSRWLVSTLIPTNSKFYTDSLVEAPVQNFILVAVNSEEMTVKSGYMEFSDYCKGLYERQKSRGVIVNELSTATLSGKKSFYWTSKIARDGKDPIIQEQYMFQLAPFYTLFQFTHSANGQTTDSKKILSSVVFKK